MSSVGRSRRAAATAIAVTLTGGLVAGVTSAASVASAASAAPCATNTYTRQFFANTGFSGAAKRTDCDAAIGENWGTNSTGVTGVGKDGFGVRWSVDRDFGSGGPFTFAASGQDGIRVYLDGVRKIDLWKNGTATVSKTLSLTIPKGTHTLRVDYANWTGAAAVKFAYTPGASGPDNVAPLPPTGVKVVYDEHAGSATLTWAANREMDLAPYPYQVYRQIGGTGWIPMGSLNKTTWTDPEVPQDGRPRQYTVSAADQVRNVSVGGPVLTVTPPDTIIPLAPTLGVHHRANTASSLEISWTQSYTFDELADGGVLALYPSTGDALGDHPELITRVTAASPTPDYYVDEMPSFDGTTYTYAAVVTDAAGNVSPMSKPVTVTPDSVPPPALTGLTATPRADGVVLSWDLPAESGLSYVAARVLQRPDGSISYDSAGCEDAGGASQSSDVPNALLCEGTPDGETVTFFVVAVDPWANHVAWADAPTVTVTEPDNRPDDARGEETGPLTIVNPDTIGNLGYVQWTCDDAPLCAGIVEYRMDKWNASTQTYVPYKTVAGSKGPDYRTGLSMVRGDTTYFRISGVRADGTTAAVTHGARAYGATL
ncbi:MULTISPECIES: PA14 domain-containing protein [unclassified Streptomyces]|uniref:PA14 domain-containing protein n=1 Tax=unclassified Streptomyces TaxID=2593676 RepID=UPI0013694960|nr:PA14 domain-containing protein [Streptomyces sp. DvalAA-14]MYS22484.1 cellulose 1,4-beta-cellobiosidase [Streptomyces sp. SID4948]